MTRRSKAQWRGWRDPAPAAPLQPRKRVEAARTSVRRRLVDAAMAAKPPAPAYQRISIRAVPKPRMTHADRWLGRPCVLRYRAFCDELRLRRIVLPERFVAIFRIAMPKSWPRARRDAMRGTPHRQTPDRANLLKALEDALCPHGDAHLWDGREAKLWADEDAIEILAVTGDCTADLEALMATVYPRAVGYSHNPSV